MFEKHLMLNNQVSCLTHPTITSRDALFALSTAKFFMKLDTCMALADSLSDAATSLTTFITQWSRYRFCRSPRTSFLLRMSSTIIPTLPLPTCRALVVDNCLIHDDRSQAQVTRPHCHTVCSRTWQYFQREKRSYLIKKFHFAVIMRAIQVGP